MTPPTVIPSHMRINGRIATSGDLLIEGRCTGAIEVGGTVTIAPGAHCEAFVRAHEARVEGHVAGTIICRRVVYVGPGASIVGSLEAPTVDIHPAARIQGIGAPHGVPQTPALPRGARNVGDLRAPAEGPAVATAPGKRVRVRVRGAGLHHPVPPPRRKAAPAAAKAARDQRAVPAPPRLKGRIRVARRGSSRRRGASR